MLKYAFNCSVRFNLFDFYYIFGKFSQFLSLPIYDLHIRFKFVRYNNLESFALIVCALPSHCTHMQNPLYNKNPKPVPALGNPRTLRTLRTLRLSVLRTPHSSFASSLPD